MTFITEVQKMLLAYDITGYGEEQIQAFIDLAKELVSSPLLSPTSYTDYVDDFEGITYCTKFYPVLQIDSLTIDGNNITPKYLEAGSGIMYFNKDYMGTLECSYKVGLDATEMQDDLLPIVVYLIRDKEGMNVASVSEGDVSISYNNGTGNTSASLDTMVANLKNKYDAMVRLV